MEFSKKEKGGEAHLIIQPSISSTQSSTSSHVVATPPNTSKDPTKMSTKERMRRLQAICKPGHTPLSSSSSSRTCTDGAKLRPTIGNYHRKRPPRRHVEHMDTPEGKRFACARLGGVNACMRRWMAAGTRVQVKLRANCTMARGRRESNRLLKGAIVAFDKHWNMVLRDVDEVYVPPVRLGKVQAMPGAMPKSALYTLDKTNTKGRPILTRHLKCSMVIGSSVVAVYNDENAK